MNRLFRLAALALASISLTSAQAQTADAPKPAPSPVAAPVDVDPALWVVKDKDTTIYLFGSVHVLKPGLSWFDDGVKAAFDKSDQLVLEVVLPDLATMQASVLKAAMSNDGKPLSSKLNPDELKAYQDTLATYGIPAPVMDGFDPWFVSLTLTQLALKQAGYDGETGVEKTLTAAAKAEGKPIIGLETVDQQFGFFDGLSTDSQVKLLDSTLKELPQTADKIQTMIDQWGAGDPDKLAATINEGTADTPELAKILLTDRNAHWAKWIAERMKQPGTVFIAVGAGHLAGDGSVQQQLRAYHLKAMRVAY